MTARVRPARLVADPAAAFRARARRDRARILLLAARLHGVADAATLAELERVAHGLAGAGGVFGHAEVSEAALRVERLAERWQRDETPSPRRKSRLVRAVQVLVASLATADQVGVSREFRR